MVTWLRDVHHTPSNWWIGFWEENCFAEHYAGVYQEISPWQDFNITLPDKQELRFIATAAGVLYTSGKGSKSEYFNLSDSWVDVSLYYQGDPGSSMEGENWERVDWRVYGNDPDPWDAPQHIIDSYGEWPPEGTLGYYFIKTCYHLTSTPPGEVKNIEIQNDLSDVYRNGVLDGPPNEVASWAVKGPWQGKYYSILEYNEYAHKIMYTPVRYLRIEKIELNHYKIYIKIGGGGLQNPSTLDRIIIADNTNGWETRDYIIIFDLQNHEIINYQSGFELEYPTHQDPEVIYDDAEDIEINKGVYINIQNLEDILSPQGSEIFESIKAEQSQSILDAGFTKTYNYNNLILLKKFT